MISTERNSEYSGSNPNQIKLKAEGMYSLLTDKETNVIGRKVNGEPIYLISGGCGTITQTTKDIAGKTVFLGRRAIYDEGGLDSYEHYPTTYEAANGKIITEEVAEWFKEGDEVAPGFVHNHKDRGPLIETNLRTLVSASSG